ncbi:MAG: hypothetical protein AAGC57_21475, partial [Pseudomonadota bacterium]
SSRSARRMGTVATGGSFGDGSKRHPPTPHIHGHPAKTANTTKTPTTSKGANPLTWKPESMARSNWNC